MPSSSDVVLLRVISNTNGTFEFAVELDGTVGETRALLEAQMIGETDTKRVKMTFRGVVLEKDDQVWRQLAPKDKESMYAVVMSSQSVVPSALPPVGAPSFSANPMGDQARMMEPMIDSMVSNPGFVDMLIAMSPELKEAVAKNPDMRRQLQNPEMMKLLMRSQYDPMARKEVDRALSSQMAQLNAIPGGMAMLERMMGNMLQEERYAPKTAADLKMATEENSKPQAGLSANNQEAPNPWARRPPPQTQRPPMLPQAQRSPMPFFNPFMGLGGIGQPPVGFNAPAPPSPDYSQQIAMLKDMGFEDEALIRRALEASKGDVDGAVAFIDAEQNR